MRGIWRFPMTAAATAIAPIAGSTFISYGSFWSQLEPRLGAGSNYKVKISQGVAGRGRPKDAAGLRASWIDEQVSLEIPASSQTAYSIYADLRRQPEWSPWLKSVEHEKESGRSTWVIQSRGIKVSWDARNTVEVPGTEVAWESTTGLQNRGRVTFESMDDSRCLMTLTLSYDLPGAIASVLQLDAVRKFVRWTLLSDLGRFKKVASQEVPATVSASASAASRPVVKSLIDGVDPCPPPARVAEEVGVASGGPTLELEIPSKPPRGSVDAGKDDDDGRGNSVDLNGRKADESAATVEDGIPVDISQVSELAAGQRDKTNDNDETGTGTKLSGSLGATSSPSKVEEATEKKGPRPAADDVSVVDAPMAEPRRWGGWLKRIRRRRGTLGSGGGSEGLGDPSGEALAAGNLGFWGCWRRQLRRLWLRLRRKVPD